MENGLPQNTVQALAQTKDGFLWLGTEAGLVRFDGVEFQTYDRNSVPALPGSDIRRLLVARDGALWIGTGAGLARWKDGASRTFTTQDGLPDNGIRTIEETQDGNLLVWTEQGSARMSGDRFVPVTNVGASPRAALTSPGENPGAIVFEAQMPNGVQVTADRSALKIMQGKKPAGISTLLAVGKELPGSRIQAVFADRENALWIGTNAGLVRWVNGKVERFPVTDPLATASILTLMEDREGNLWVGTETSGLDILRDQRFHTLDTRDGLTSDRITTVVEDRSGTLWAGTREDGLNALRRDESKDGWRVARNLTVKDGLASNVILSLAAAPNGDLWVGTPDGLSRIRGTTVDTFTSADGLPDDFVRSLLIDSDGSLWIGTRRGLTHWATGKIGSGSVGGMKTYTTENGLGSDLVGAMARDTRGDLWVATLAGLSRLHGEAIANFTTANGLSSNVVTALLASRRWDAADWNAGAWVGRVGRKQILRRNAKRPGANNDSRDSGRWERTSMVRDRQRHCPMRLQRDGRDRPRGRLFALDGVWDRGWAAQPGDGDKQSSFSVALARRATVVCDAEGIGGGGPGTLSRKHDSASGGSGEA